MDEPFWRGLWGIGLALIAGWIIRAIIPQPGQWLGIFYPQANETLTVYEELGRFDTLNDCRAFALDRRSRSPVPEHTDYECGLKCKVEPGWTVYTCDKTEK